ncbi:hypothetical protein [Enterovirga sp.]|uniref:hypothetical protein n=1 Tax=Enterovirga sp. TaxID=2026350 RepID=UPI002C5E8E27|nr:hypothetical protein [Enterovirga sp.]HMO30227.1 hypothetical protein [Enterovirga sp.]
MSMSHSGARKLNAQKLRDMGYRPGPTDESFSDFVKMKVLARKRIEQYGNPFGANAFPMILAQHKELLRNVCVRVDAPRIAELDAVTEILDCNKQEFVLELLVAGIEQAKAALREAGLESVFDAAVDRKLEEAGFTVAPPHEDGFWRTLYRGEQVINRNAAQHEKAAGALSRTIKDTLPDRDE